MDTPKKQLEAVLKAIAPIMLAEFSLKKVNRTFYRYVSDMIQVITFTPSSWNTTGGVSFTGNYRIGHIFESQLHQNRDDSIDPTRIYAFESGNIARWRIHSDGQIQEVAGQVLVNIRDILAPVFAAYSSDIGYLRALQIHPADGDGDILRRIKMNIYRDDFAGALREVDGILEKEDLWLRAPVRQFYPYLERKSPT